MASRPPETPEHAARRRALATIEKSVSDLQSDQYGFDELRKIAIEILPLSLSSAGLPSTQPLFFRPFEKFIDESELDLDCDYPDYSLSDEWKDCNKDEPDYGVTPMDWARNTKDYFHSYLGSLLASNVPDAPAYREHNFYDSIDAWKCQLYDVEKGFAWQAAGLGPMLKTPHRKCFMICDVNGDENRIARGELLCIARIMHRFYNTQSLINFMVVPVFSITFQLIPPDFNEIFQVLVLSFVGPSHGRILEAHYNGSKLVIRKSKLFDFSNNNLAAMMIFARWWCSSATGDVLSA
ncbi:hypothetical protein BDV18DRAFT_160279 [Aspergillus unguis]